MTDNLKMYWLTTTFDSLVCVVAFPLCYTFQPRIKSDENKSVFVYDRLEDFAC